MPNAKEYARNIEYYHNYNHSEKRKEAIKRYMESSTGRTSAKESVIKYRQTEKYKPIRKKHRAKMKAKRERKFMWFQMFSNPFDESELVDWHHITDAYVVAIPKYLHQLYGGKNHRENTMEIVKQIYL